MARTRTVFFCSACGFEAPRWLGRCPSCQAWNTFSEAPTARLKRDSRSEAAPRGPVRLTEIDDSQLARLNTGLSEFDTVLGGGIVPGSLTLIGGPPGAGKSTLLLQIAMRLIRNDIRVVYLCGEESASQIKLRAQRLRGDEDVLVFPETNLRAALDELERISPQVLIVDSIQTVWLPESESYAGSIGQIRDCAQALMEFSKRTDCATFIVGHVTKDGTIAG
ncbi:MAG: AAA family ATPase, partial [Candidatus Eremiobacteraeota bacterium]|nr:AAA family ATPase [Candidatus Eremiobacteraeota bacterium]